MNQMREGILDWFFSTIDDPATKSAASKWMDIAHVKSIVGMAQCKCALHEALHHVTHLIRQRDKAGIRNGSPWIQAAFMYQVEDFIKSTWPPELQYALLVAICQSEFTKIIEENNLPNPDAQPPNQAGPIRVVPLGSTEELNKIFGELPMLRARELKALPQAPEPEEQEDEEEDEEEEGGDSDDEDTEDVSSDSADDDTDNSNEQDHEDIAMNANDKNPKNPKDNAVTDMPAGLAIFKDGVKIEPPPGTTYNQMIQALERQAAEEEQLVLIRERVDAFVLEGAVAFQEALKEEFGWVEKGAGKSDMPSFIESLFGAPPPRPVVMIPVQTSPTTTTQVIWDQIRMTGVDGTLRPGFEYEDGRFFFLVTGGVKRKHEARVRKVIETARRIVKARSIYKGHALEIDLPTGDMLDVMKHAPRFMTGLDAVDPKGLIFTRKLEEELETYVFNIVRHTKLLAKLGISAHRGALFMGPPGTGKSYAAAVTAKIAEENGWTFFYLKKPDQIVPTYKLASEYGDGERGAILFVEDVDQAVLKGGQEDEVDEEAREKFRKLLNALDGIDTKGAQVFVIFTTNKDPRTFDPAFTRESRLDSIINFTPPDQEAADRLLRWYLGDRLEPSADLTAASAQLAGLRPASIKEVAAKATLGAAARLLRSGTAIDLNNLPISIINGHDIEVAVRVSKEQLELAKPLEKAMVPDSDEERSAVFLGKHIESAAARLATTLERFLPPEQRSNGHSKLIEGEGEVPALTAPTHTS